MDSTHADTTRWFVAEVQPHRPLLRTWLLTRFPALQDVDDLVEESVVRVVRARENGPIRSARALLYTTARNLAVDASRRQRVVRFEPLTETDESSVLAINDDVGEQLNREQEYELLNQAIQTLPRRYRDILMLRLGKGMKPREIGERVGVSESTVEKQMAHAVRLCAAYFAARSGR